MTRTAWIEENAVKFNFDGFRVSFLAFDLDQTDLMSHDAANAALCMDEHVRAERFHFDHHRTRFIMGRAVLRSMLVHHLDASHPPQIQLQTGPQGKPFVEGNPIWFNLSHSEQKAALAWSYDGPIGVDIERIARQSDLMGLATRVFTEKEKAVLSETPHNRLQRQFFRFWTAKEALMKLTGQGMSLAPDQIELDLTNGLPTGFVRPEPMAKLRYLDTDDDTICAVAFRSLVSNPPFSNSGQA